MPVRLIHTCLFGASILLTLNQSVAAQTPVTIEDVVTAWRERQQRTTSARFICKGTQFFSARTLVPERMRQANDFPAPPVNGIRFAATNTIVLAESKMRYQTTGKLWDAEAGRLVDSDAIAVSDGVTSLDYLPVSANAYPQGIIHSHKRNSEINNVNTRAVLLHYRPFHPDTGGLRGEDLHLANKSAVIRGRPCILIQQTLPEPKATKRSYWADTERDFSVVRYTLEQGTSIGVKLDIDYAHDKEHRWVPSGWDIAFMDNAGSVYESFNGQITEYAVNKHITSEEFRIDFPAGTRVTDRRTRSTLGNYTEYILRSDGTKRLIPRADLGATYNQLLATDPGKALFPDTHFPWKLILGINLFFLAVAAVFGVLRYRRARSRSVTT